MHFLKQPKTSPKTSPNKYSLYPICVKLIWNFKHIFFFLDVKELSTWDINTCEYFN